MSDQQNQSSADVGRAELRGIVMLPPYIEPGHKLLIESAEKTLEEYSEYLTNKINDELFKHGCNIEPHPADVREAHIRFNKNPTRIMLVNQLLNLKAMFERPRFLIRSI